jgi:ferric-dicitrate binding protein FerR (iron transport regulator)
VVLAARRARSGRRLWGRDRGGRFRTHGKHSHATVRGTRWLVEDRCDGTLTRVTAGSVVVRDTVRGKRVIVRAGERYLARPRR